MERERTFLALSLGDPSQMWDVCVDRDSDLDKSVTAGTEEHSSFSEQAWDFYQVLCGFNTKISIFFAKSLSLYV